MLRLSFFMCNANRIDDAMEEVESQNIPVWNELVAEGMVVSFGYFVHRWADEWNVGIYTVAESIDAVIKASAEAGRRIEEKYGDGPTVFGEACPHHAMWAPAGHRDSAYGMYHCGVIAAAMRSTATNRARLAPDTNGVTNTPA